MPPSRPALWQALSRHIELQRPARRTDPAVARSPPCSSGAANRACVGAEPLGTTTTSIRNPDKPHIAWHSRNPLAGLGDLPGLSAPIVVGNVSLYTEGATSDLNPTPVIAWSGASRRRPRRAPRLPPPGDAIALVRPFAPSQAPPSSQLRGSSFRTAAGDRPRRGGRCAGRVARRGSLRDALERPDLAEASRCALERNARSRDASAPCHARLGPL